MLIASGSERASRVANSRQPCIGLEAFASKYKAKEAVKDKLKPHVEYYCKDCGWYHIKETIMPVNEVEAPHKIAGRNYFRLFQGLTLARVKLNEGNYIFVVPSDIEEWDTKVLSMGLMVAHRYNGPDFLDSDGKVDINSKAYNQLPCIHVKEANRGKKLIELHKSEMMPFDDARAHVIMGFLFVNIEERTGNKSPMPVASEVTPELKKESRPLIHRIEMPEMWNGRAVFRTEDDRPYHRDDVTCAGGCGKKIELRAYIWKDANGNFSTVATKQPAESGVVVEGSRSNKTYTCPQCAGKQQQREAELEDGPTLAELVEAAREQGAEVHVQLDKDPHQPVIEHLDGLLLKELQRISKNRGIDAEFLRGYAMFMPELLI